MSSAARLVHTLAGTESIAFTCLSKERMLLELEKVRSAPASENMMLLVRLSGWGSGASQAGIWA
jgi:hypothetical protein